MLRFVGFAPRVVAALATRAGACDVAGTYARTVKGVSVGPWSQLDRKHKNEIEVLARFGSIPPDVIAAHRDVNPMIQARLADTLRLACVERKDAMRAIFGGVELKTGPASGYDALTAAIGTAKLRGLFD